MILLKEFSSKVGVNLPSQLLHLTLGNDFSHSLDGMSWPSTLKTLVLGRVPQLHFIDLPDWLVRVLWLFGVFELIRSKFFGIICIFFATKMDCKGRLGMVFSSMYNYVGVSKNRFFSPKMDGLNNGKPNPIKIPWIWGVKTHPLWKHPCSLQASTFQRFGLQDFNQSLNNVTFPASLESLRFGESFNWPLDASQSIFRFFEVFHL